MLKQIIDSVYPISSKIISDLEEEFEIEKFSKDEVFIKQKKVNDKEYFLTSGIVRSFLISPENEDVTISFFTGPCILSPYTTRSQNQRSIYNYQALTDITVSTINASKFESFMIENIEIRTFGNTVLRNELMLKVQKEVGLASLTAKERLLIFREHFPMLENQIPHPLIASYLGITNISLSRLRKELRK